MKKHAIAAILTAAICIPVSASAWFGAGDMDNDGEVNAFDLAIMKREYYREKDDFESPDDFPMEADVNENDAFNAYDVSQMQDFLLGRISNFSDSTLAVSEQLNEPAALQSGEAVDEVFTAAQMEFAADLFRNTAQNDENTLISPLSVSIALSMAANGADTQTLSEMEAVLGGSMDKINSYMAYYLNDRNENAGSRVNIANSIWFREDESLTVHQDFLDANSHYYDAQIFATPFDDNTVKDVNSWVKNRTDGMIPKLVDELKKENMMLLINAITFDARWDETYDEYQVEEGTFTAADGTEQKAEMMHGTEGSYYEFDNAVGFCKYYDSYDYRFVAILPDEGMSVSEWIAQMDAQAVLAELDEPDREYDVITQIPKFSYETDLTLKDALKAMGMPTAFDMFGADFSRMAEYRADLFGMGEESYSLHIGDVLHKTSIDLNEDGTRASAVTAIQMDAPTCAPDPQYKYVTLDRPFVYMIVDNDNIPLFMGTVQSVE